MKYLLKNEESERLLFRKLKESDFEWWMEFASNAEATRYFDFTGSLIPINFCRIWFEKVFDRYKNNTGGHNVLVERTTNNPVGMCGLLIQEVDGIKELEIGYSIHPKYWGNGFATEAAKKCKEFAFKNNFAKSVISIIHIDNGASTKVAMKNGMTLEKTTNYKGIRVNIFRIAKSEKQD